MEINEQHIELFDNYIFNRLSTDEKQNFEQKLLQDSIFAQDFETYKILVLGIQDLGKAELKDFLKAQPKPEIKTILLWRKPLAIAASLALLITIGYFAKNSFLPKTDEIAIKNEPKIEPTITAPQQKDSIQPTITFTEIESVKKDEDNNLIEVEKQMADADPPPVLLDDYEIEAASKSVPNAPLKTTENDDDYKVLTEKKLSDTLIFANLLALNDDKKDRLAEESLKTNGYATKKKSAQIPATVNNNVGRTMDNNTNFRLDTIEFKKLEKRKTQSITKYTLEFWQSPLNFKGYKFVGNTIQLYGIANNNIKVFLLNNTTYLRANGEVYPLKYCTDACLYKPEIDIAIVNFILAQP